jgi:predicted transcriptional regulator
LRSEGQSLDAIAAVLGVGRASVSRALAKISTGSEEAP